MARKSAAALSVVVANIDGRPRAPADLTEFQAGVWERTVANEAADTFKTAALQQLLLRRGKIDSARHCVTIP